MSEYKNLDFMIHFLRKLGSFALIPPTGYLDDAFLSEAIYTLFDKERLSYEITSEPDETVKTVVMMAHPNIQQVETLLKRKQLKHLVFLPNRYMDEKLCLLLDKRCVVFCRDEEALDFVDRHTHKITTYLIDDLSNFVRLENLNYSEKKFNAIPLGKRYTIWHFANQSVSNIQSLNIDQRLYYVGFFLKGTPFPGSVDMTECYNGKFANRLMTKWLCALFISIIRCTDIVVTNQFYVALVAKKLGKMIFLWNDDNAKKNGMTLKQKGTVYTLTPSFDFYNQIKNIIKNVPSKHSAERKKFNALNPVQEADIHLYPLKKTKLKICFVLDHFIMGGVEMIASTILPELAKQYKITLLLKRRMIDVSLIDQLRIKGVSVYFPPSQRSEGIWQKIRYLYQTKKYRKLCSTNLSKSDLIVDYNVFCAMPVVATIKDVPKIAFIHNSFLYLRRIFSPQLLSCYDGFVCLSQSCKNDWIDLCPPIKNKLFQIYNPLDIEGIRQKALEYKAPTHKYFVAVQRLDMDKDVETIVKAFNLFCQTNKDVYLYIIGDGPQKDNLSILAKANKRIVLMGKVYNPYPMIKGAEALVLSTDRNWGEGLGQVLLEAQALETLAISSDVKSGPAEILMNGKAGCLFPAHNDEALCEIMLDVISKKIDASKLIKTATANLYRFNKQMIVDQISDLFQSAVNHKI